MGRMLSLVTVGVAATAAAATLLVLGWFARPRRAPYPLYGYAGLAVLVVAELLLFRRVEPVATYFTPIAWTAFWSVPLWLVFEAYNWRLKNWEYVGMPEALWEQALGSIWAFATIIPALVETSDLLAALGWFERATSRGWCVFLRHRRALGVTGAVFLLLPLAVPVRWAAYLFALVWLGFAFLLEPVNYARGHDSLFGELERDRGQRLYCLFAAGLVCGLLWEFWNYWAAARWVYVFPMFQQVKIFEMPLPGYLGFPAFAVECFALLNFVRGETRRLRR